MSYILILAEQGFGASYVAVQVGGEVFKDLHQTDL